MKSNIHAKTTISALWLLVTMHILYVSTHNECDSATAPVAVALQWPSADIVVIEQIKAVMLLQLEATVIVRTIRSIVNLY